MRPECPLRYQARHPAVTESLKTKLKTKPKPSRRIAGAGVLLVRNAAVPGWVSMPGQTFAPQAGLA